MPLWAAALAQITPDAIPEGTTITAYTHQPEEEEIAVHPNELAAIRIQVVLEKEHVLPPRLTDSNSQLVAGPVEKDPSGGYRIAPQGTVPSLDATVSVPSLVPGVGPKVLSASGAQMQRAATKESVTILAPAEMAVKADVVTVYRGVPEGHEGFPLATMGYAEPRGGHANPLDHNMGDTQSVFTSWTIYKDVAEGFAIRRGTGGALLTLTTHRSRLIKSPNVADPNEGEVLIEGTVEAKFEWVPPPRMSPRRK